MPTWAPFGLQFYCNGRSVLAQSGRCIKHSMGAASVKVYDKFSRVLRIDATVNDISFFKHHRKVEHRDGHNKSQPSLCS